MVVACPLLIDAKQLAYSAPTQAYFLPTCKEKHFRTMRLEMIESSSPYSMNQESPKASSVWSTDRRLLERPPPGRPQKSGRRSSLSSGYMHEQDNYEASTKKQRNDRLLLPSRTINEDEDSSNIALNFRRTNLTSLLFNNSVSDLSSELLLHKDPTTVLLIPETSPLPWYSNDDDENDDDLILSSRLFQFDQQHQPNLSCFASIDIADDDTSSNNNIFRELNSDDDDYNNCFAESRDLLNDEIIQRRYTWANTAALGFPFEATTSDDDNDDRS